MPELLGEISIPVIIISKKQLGTII
ncbi:protein of unknown function [Cupriavidus taiwanensis]|nr:protein of unknown function [Cupriavidus taiwanensis]